MAYPCHTFAEKLLKHGVVIMEFNFNKYSYRGIQDLCRIHYREIMDRKDVKDVLDNRLVRFITPIGTFDYAYFGDFYFDGDVMMLITRNLEYTRFHKPDQLSNTLWSTVPVIYAGVNTRFRDDCHQDIYTGDVASRGMYTSFVRYFGSSEIPGLAGDNCEVLFEGKEPIHKEGTVFSGITRTLFKEFSVEQLYWPTNQFYPYGLTREEVIERASQAISRPKFADGFAPRRGGRRLAYKEISEVLQEGDILCYFEGDPYEDEDIVERFIYADNIPDGYTGEEYSIHLDFENGFGDSIRAAFNQFLLYAHQYPQKTFVMCDCRKELMIQRYFEPKAALYFMDWFDYRIPNVIMPFWILSYIGVWNGIGRD